MKQKEEKSTCEHYEQEKKQQTSRSARLPTEKTIFLLLIASP